MTDSTCGPLLITGASGFLGWNLCKVAIKDFNVIAVRHRHPCPVDGIREIGCDLTDPVAVGDLLRECRPGAVVHTAAAADPNHCQHHERETSEINITVPENIARICREADIPFVFTSTDLVFDGTRAPYREEYPVSPVSVYGRQKATAERKILAIGGHGLVCRLPLMYGDAPQHAKSFLQSIISAIRNGSGIDLFYDEFRTPLSARDAAFALIAAVRKKIRGVLHLGGPERLSRYEMGCLIADTLGMHAEIRRCSRVKAGMAAPRPPDVTLDNSKACSVLPFSPGEMSRELHSLDCVREITQSGKA